MFSPDGTLISGSADPHCGAFQATRHCRLLLVTANGSDELDCRCWFFTVSVNVSDRGFRAELSIPPPLITIPPGFNLITMRVTTPQAFNLTTMRVTIPQSRQSDHHVSYDSASLQSGHHVSSDSAKPSILPPCELLFRKPSI